MSKNKGKFNGKKMIVDEYWRAFPSFPQQHTVLWTGVHMLLGQASFAKRCIVGDRDYGFWIWFRLVLNDGRETNPKEFKADTLARWQAEDIVNEIERLAKAEEPSSTMAEGGGRPSPMVFLSHASADKGFVSKLGGHLQSKGISTWEDVRKLLGGQDLPNAIGEAIAKCDFVCYCFSKAAVASSWVRSELSTAMIKELRERRVVIIPIRIDDIGFDRIETLLQAKFVIDFHAPKHYDPHEKLVRSILDQYPAASRERTAVVGYNYGSPTELLLERIDVEITGDLHTYRLRVVLTNNDLEMIEAFKLRLFFPSGVPISAAGFKQQEGQRLGRRGTECYEIESQNGQRIFPGEKIVLSDRDTEIHLEYQVNDRVLESVAEVDRDVYWELFTDKRRPVVGQRKFRELQIF